MLEDWNGLKEVTEGLEGWEEGIGRSSHTLELQELGGCSLAFLSSPHSRVYSVDGLRGCIQVAPTGHSNTVLFEIRDCGLHTLFTCWMGRPLATVVAMVSCGWEIQGHIIELGFSRKQVWLGALPQAPTLHNSIVF